MNDIYLIKNNNELSKFIRLIENNSAVGIDTEFMRRSTYWPILSLIQISDGNITALIDMISTNIDFNILHDLFENPSLTKIFHSGEQDLEILWSNGAIVNNIFDTQIASMFSGYKAQIAYSELVELSLGKHINKNQQNSNWIARPLKKSQILYAAQDVEFLPKLHKILIEKISEKNLSLWVEEEMRFLEQNRDIYIKKNSIDSVSDLQVFAKESIQLSPLVNAWRELIAKKRNVPRSWICSNESIKYVCDNSNLTNNILKINSYLKLDNIYDLIECIKIFNLNKIETSQNNIHKFKNSKIVKELRLLLENQCKIYDISPQLVANRLDLDNLSKNQDNVRSLHGWRYKVFGEKALQYIGNYSKKYNNLFLYIKYLYELYYDN